MNIPNLSPLNPYIVHTCRPIRLRFIDERELIEDSHATTFLINHVVPLHNLKWLRKFRHLAGIGGGCLVTRVDATLQSRARSAVRNGYFAITPAVEVCIASGLDDGAGVALRGRDGFPGFFGGVGKVVLGVEQPVAVVGDDRLDVRYLSASEKEFSVDNVGVLVGGCCDLGEGRACFGVVETAVEIDGDGLRQEAFCNVRGRVVLQVRDIGCERKEAWFSSGLRLKIRGGDFLEGRTSTRCCSLGGECHACPEQSARHS